MIDTKIYKELQQIIQNAKNKNLDIIGYIRHFYHNTSFCNMIDLLQYAYPKNQSELNQIVKDIIINEKEIIAVYPTFGDTPPINSKLICDIPDGALYIL